MVIASNLSFLLSTLLLYRCSNAQLLLDVFENTALVGSPTESRHLSSLSNFSIENPNGDANNMDYSARILGSLDLKLISESFAIQCQFSKEVSAALVWIDDHLVCQNGLYNVTGSVANRMDGTPNTPLSRLRRTTLLFRAHLWSSSTAKGSILWSMVTRENTMTKTLQNGNGFLLQEDKSHIYTDIPFNALLPTISEPERNRIVMAEKLTQGWGLWNHKSIFEFILLPEGLRLSLLFCNNRTGQCWDQAIPSQDLARVTAPIASDFSFLEYHVYLADHKVNITVSMSGRLADTNTDSGINDRLLLLVDTVQCDCCCEDMNVHFVGDVAYRPLRSGTVTKNTNGTALNLNGSNLRNIDLYLDRDSSQVLDDGNNNEIVVPLAPPGKAVGISSGKEPMLVSNIRAEIDTMKQIELAKYQKIYPDNSFMAKLLMATQAAVVWNWIYTPAEFSPLAPVSRGWNFIDNGFSGDFGYVIFDWDNELASLLMAHSTAPKEMAYSNLIQVVRSKTYKGFIPNFAAGGMKSQDRTEPPLGAKVLEELYKLHDDKWILDLLWDDLADNIDWFFRERLIHGLIALGSDSVSYAGRWSGHDMQCARFESGLDNSPMYDGDFFDNKTNLMQMYDVGMTSLVIMELECLARLGRVINKPHDVISEMRERAKQLRNNLSQKLWDENQGIYANRHWNGTFTTRISPTSFYPLLAGAPSVLQVSSMMKSWLLNSSKFCIDQTWPDSSNSDKCWWGLPSIAADDRAFPALGYWRGYIWGPMAQIVYWSLSNEKYGTVPSVRVARKALSKQMTSMFLNVWQKHGRVCENFSPHRDVDDCTGDYFYHWGALCGLLTIEEENFNSKVESVY